jgi:hypothetical protein
MAQKISAEKRRENGVFEPPCAGGRALFFPSQGSEDALGISLVTGFEYIISGKIQAITC